MSSQDGRPGPGAPHAPISTGLRVDVAVASRDLELAFTVAAGETIALLGPNGAGKSTALAVVAGLLRPDVGTVELDDRVLSGPRRFVAPHDRRVALLAQDPLLFPHLDAAANVAFGPRSQGVSRRRAHEQARSWLSEVGVEDLHDRRPAQLSGGQAQRVAVARALAAQPRVLLLDEPMAALDVAVAPALRQTLRRVLGDQTTVLVTHDVLDALLLADRVLVLEAGRVVEEGACTEVLSRPRSEFAARIAGLNLLPGRWTGDTVEVAGERVHGVPTPTPTRTSAPTRTSTGPALLTPGQSVVAVFRPASVAVHDAAVRPAGSPRNSFEVVIAELEPLGDRIRVRGQGAVGTLAADVTPQSVADLALAPGLRAWFTVKATEVALYPR